MIELKPCPFCGAKITPFINDCKNNPNHWTNGLWYIRDTHRDDCFLKYDEHFEYLHYGKAINGEPTDDLLHFIEKWNRRAE